MANRYDSAHLRAEQHPNIPHKKQLHDTKDLSYSVTAFAKSKDRIRTLKHYSATHDAQRVFFCVNACAHLYNQFSSMVALVGHLQRWLVSEYASGSNPANVTANEIRTSSGDYINHYSEAATMATIPTSFLSNQKLFKFFNFSSSIICQIIAPSELQAREQLGNQSLIFMARLPSYPTVKSSIVCGGYAHV
ncbi:ash family protein [Orbaceae bacterium ESL0721]|nr:ash family protein [Orbaceae bacterium ESL0721]